MSLRALLHQQAGAAAAPPLVALQATALRALLATAAAADIGTGAPNQTIPSTAAIVGAVVGGIGMLTLCLATALAFAMFSIYGGQLWWPRRCNATPGATAAAGSKEVCSVLESTSEGHSLPSIVSSRLEGTPSHEIGTPMTSGDILTEVSEVSRSGLSTVLPLREDASWRDCLIEPDQIQFLRRRDGSPWCLGGGAFGQVYKALYDGVQVVAAKVITGLADERILQDFAREAAILRDMRDRNIVQFVGVCPGKEEDGQENQAMMVQEFMEAGDLFKALRWRDEKGARVYGWHQRGRTAACDIARGLHYLHNHKIIHLDIKSSNVMLTRDGTCKIGDVGLARSLMTKPYLTQAGTLGTFAWSSPEVLTGQPVTYAADIYSLGIVLWEIVTGEIPTRGRMREALVPEECPQEAVTLIDQCLAQDPAARPTAKQIVQQLERMGVRQRAEARAAQRQAEEQRKVSTGHWAMGHNLPQARSSLAASFSTMQTAPIGRQQVLQQVVPVAAPAAAGGGSVAPQVTAQQQPAGLPPPTPPESTGMAAAPLQSEGS